MSKPLTRLGDNSKGHGCFPPRPCITGASTVYTNGIPNHRQTDLWDVHCCITAPHICHDGFLVTGSPTVYTEGLQQSRRGDPVSCGDTAFEGSPTVFVGP